MKILFVNAYFYPENIAFSHLERDIIEGLQNAGHEISVVCPIPSRGISDDAIREYRKKKREEYNGVQIRRFWTPREGKNPIARALRYFWCNFMSAHIGKRYRDIDVIFAVSTPPTQGLSAGKLAQKLKVPFIYSLQDVFPDSLVTTGLTSKHSCLYKIGTRIERKTYSRCSKIIVISESIRQNLCNKGVDENKLVTIGNWIDTEDVRPVPKDENRLFDEFQIDRNKFNVVYAGNFGASQGADVILKAADLLKDNINIRFVIFGGGAEFSKAQDYAAKHHLNNVKIFSLLSTERSAEVYSLGDVALITCKKGVGKTGMPSKTWTIMACNTPIIASFDTDSELATILKEAHAGVCVEPEDPRELSKQIIKLYNHYHITNLLDNSEINGRQYVVCHASRQKCVQKYIEVFERLFDQQ